MSSHKKVPKRNLLWSEISQLKAAATRRSRGWVAALHAQVAQIYVCLRWYFLGPAIRAHGLPATLVVSLTSYPPRFDTLIHTLRSLLRQSVKADRIILWVSPSNFPLLPKKVTALQEAGLEIRMTTDLGSYNKIIPALEAFPDAFICTADDDMYYWPTWLEELIREVSCSHRVVSCHRAHQITFDFEGHWQPYKQWINDTRVRGGAKDLFPTGVLGILYPPGILKHSADDRKAALTLCQRADDVWLFWIGTRNGAIYKTTPKWRDITMWPRSQKLALWHDNMLRGGNDEQIRQMIHRYGYPQQSREVPP